MSKNVPMRTCVACRSEFDKRELIRVVASQGIVKIDMSGKADGRGAYICRNIRCIEKSRKAHLLSRSLKCEVPNEIYDELTKEIECD